MLSLDLEKEKSGSASPEVLELLELKRPVKPYVLPASQPSNVVPERRGGASAGPNVVGVFSRVWSWLWRLAQEIVRGRRIVRLVGPNSRPLERHEFENLEFRSVRGPGSWNR